MSSSIDDKCKHVPEKLYIWKIPELKQTLYMAHCKKCHTDYSMEKLDYIRKAMEMAKYVRKHR